MRGIICLALCALTLGCDAAEGDGPEADLGAAVDGAIGEADAGLPDATVDATPDAAGPTCAESVRAGETFALDPDGPDTQIHPHAAFDGAAIWVAYNRPRPDGKFDVFLARFGCDGVALAEPRRVNEAQVGNHVDPVIAMGAGGALVAWATDDGSAEDNLSVWVRAFDPDGAPIDAPGRLPFPANAWMVDLTPTEGGFRLAAAAADPAAMQFQMQVIDLDADGAPLGPATIPFPDPAVSQSDPAIAGAHLAWTARGDAEVAMHGWLDGDAPAAPLGEGAGALTAVAMDPDGVAYTAWTGVGPGGDLEVMLSDGGAPVPIGEPGENDHTPAIAPVAGGGAIAFLRIIRGIRNGLHVARFRAQGAALDVEQPTELVLEAPAGGIYAPGLVAVGPDLWFLTWAEGMSPAFRAMGRFVHLP